MCSHFAYKHPKANLIISGSRNVEKCNKCGMKPGARENEEKQDLQAEAEKVTFTSNGMPVERTHHFKHL